MFKVFSEMHNVLLLVARLGASVRSLEIYGTTISLRRRHDHFPRSFFYIPFRRFCSRDWNLLNDERRFVVPQYRPSRQKEAPPGLHRES